MNIQPMHSERQRGFALLEVLITILLVAFGLLGLSGMQAKMGLAEVEAYQRAQAILLVSDMADRMRASPFAICSDLVLTDAQRNQCMAVRLQSYVTSTPVGTGDDQPTDCSSKAVGAARDECEWSNSLKGAAETTAAASGRTLTSSAGSLFR